MLRERTVTRLYILFNHALFGQGLHSLLRGQRAIQIVGMGKHEPASLREMKSSQPEVIIVEQSSGENHPSIFGSMLQQKAVNRVIALDLDDNFATVYERHRLAITGPEDLINAIQSGSHSQFPAARTRGGLSKSQPTILPRGKSPPGRRARAGP